MSNKKVEVELALKGLSAQVDKGASLKEFAESIDKSAGNAVKSNGVIDALNSLSDEADAEAEDDLGGSFWGEDDEKLNIQVDLTTGKVSVSTI
jgi:hypothetical protein